MDAEPEKKKEKPDSDSDDVDFFASSDEDEKERPKPKMVTPKPKAVTANPPKNKKTPEVLVFQKCLFPVVSCLFQNGTAIFYFCLSSSNESLINIMIR